VAIPNNELFPAAFLSLLDENRLRYLRTITYLYKLAPDDAEDLLQEALARFCSAAARNTKCMAELMDADPADASKDFERLLWRIIENCFIDSTRKRQRRPEELLESRMDEAISEEQFGESPLPSPLEEAVANEYETVLPEFFRHLAKMETTSDAQLHQALAASAGTFHYSHSVFEQFLFMCAFFSKQSQKLGFPSHGEIKRDLCQRLKLQPPALDVRVCRMRPKWVAATQHAFIH
jgi:DNA-directed RNA polymerase specialized sigma24 family protein